MALNWLRGLFAREHRESYTDLVLRAQYNAAVGLKNAVAGAEVAAARLLARSLSTARVTGDRGLLTPSVLADIAHALVRSGNSYHSLRARPDASVALVPAVCVGLQGGAAPDSWRYQIDLPGPTTAEQFTAAPDAVLHVRQHAPPARPWEGRAPLAEAVTTGVLASRLEASLGEEMAVAICRYVTTPTGAGDTHLNRIEAQFKGLIDSPRKFGLAETQKQSGGAGMATAPMRDMIPEAIGPAPMPATVSLHECVFAEVLLMCGVPPSLGRLGDVTTGQTIREATRVMKTHTLGPMARLIEQETSRLLGVPVQLDLDALDTPDIVGKVRAGQDADRGRATPGRCTQGGQPMRILTHEVAPGVVAPDLLQLAKSEARVGSTPSAEREASWIAGAWNSVEEWTRRLWLPGDPDRVCTYELELEPADAPLVPSHSNTRGAVVQTLERWNDGYATYGDYKLRPGGQWRPEDAGNYKLVVVVTPPVEIPMPVQQAAMRASAWLRSYSRLM